MAKRHNETITMPSCFFFLARNLKFAHQELQDVAIGYLDILAIPAQTPVCVA